MQVVILAALRRSQTTTAIRVRPARGRLQGARRGGQKAPGDLHNPQGQGHGGGTLSADMHQVPPQHPIGIHHEVMARPPCGKRAGDRLGRVGVLEDRHQAGVDAGLLGPQPSVAVET
jgi:hypothetical protein